MAHQSEISCLSTAMDKATSKIDQALDEGNRRDFMAWCKRRALLVARRERALLAEATAEVTA